MSPQSKIHDEFLKTGGYFKSVKAGELFSIKSNPQLDKECFIFSENSDYPYFTRTVFNNGILGCVDYLDEDHLIPGNSIAVGMMGMKFFYQSHDFYAGQFTKTIFPKFTGFNEKVALWFITWFNMYSNALKGILVRNFEDSFNNIDIEIPVKENRLDLNYIESRIRELEESRIRELEAYLSEAGFDNCTLTKAEDTALHSVAECNYKGKYFEIESLYRKLKLNNIDFDKKKDTSAIQSEEFSVPLVNAKVGNNGIMYYGRPLIFQSEQMTIDIIQNGAIATGRVYAQPQPTGVLWDAYLIKAIQHQDSEDSLLFIACTIEKRIKPFFNRDLKATWDRIKHMKIYLPVNVNGTVDLALIESFVSAMKKRIISNLKQFIEKEHQAYVDVTKK